MDTPKSTYKCPHCEYVYEYDVMINQKIKCRECGKEFGFEAYVYVDKDEGGKISIPKSRNIP